MDMPHMGLVHGNHDVKVFAEHDGPNVFAVCKRCGIGTSAGDLAELHDRFRNYWETCELIWVSDVMES